MKFLEIVGIIAIAAVVLLGILTVAGVDTGFIQPPDGIYPPDGDLVDLRLISQPYIEATGIKDYCLASGAAWHEDVDFVGCVGMGPNSCSSDIVLSGQTQCIGAGAEWFCETGVQGAVYCAYQTIDG